MIFAKWVHFFSRTILPKQGDYRAHYAFAIYLEPCNMSGIITVVEPPGDLGLEQCPGGAQIDLQTGLARKWQKSVILRYSAPINGKFLCVYNW